MSDIRQITPSSKRFVDYANQDATQVLKSVSEYLDMAQSRGGNAAAATREVVSTLQGMGCPSLARMVLDDARESGFVHEARAPERLSQADARGLGVLAAIRDENRAVHDKERTSGYHTTFRGGMDLDFKPVSLEEAAARLRDGYVLKLEVYRWERPRSALGRLWSGAKNEFWIPNPELEGVQVSRNAGGTAPAKGEAYVKSLASLPEQLGVAKDRAARAASRY